MKFQANRMVERSVAICELLAIADPPELRRAHVARIEGKPERFTLISHLTGVFVQSKLLELEEVRRIGQSGRSDAVQAPPSSGIELHTPPRRR